MYQHLQLLDRAKDFAITVKDVSQLMQKNAAVLEKNGRSELVIDGVPTSWINVRSQFYCDNKQLTKLAYKALNIPHPKSIVFEAALEAAVRSFLRKGQAYVCKPLDGTNGVGVRLDIRDFEAIRRYCEEFANLETTYLLEEQIKGEDLRIHAIGGEIVAACIREPAYVLGNGKATLEQLIKERRAVMRTQNPNNFLEIDSSTEALLAKQKIGLSDKPAIDQKVQLKAIANMAQGAFAIDVTDKIHPVYKQWVADLSTYLNTGYFGLDCMTTDYTKHPAEHGYVLEVNARGDWLHHTFSERKTHDMPSIILRALFGASLVAGY